MAKAKEKEVTKESAGAAGAAGRMTMAALKTGVSMRFTSQKGENSAHNLRSPSLHVLTMSYVTGSLQSGL